MATQPTPGTRMTADELIKLSEGEKFYELVRGVLRVSEPAGGWHGLIAGNILGRLWSFVRQHDLGTVFPGDTGYFLARDPDTVRAPDVSFIRKARISFPDLGPGYIEGAPDLAVEVISPNDRASEIEEKLADYWAAAVRAVWIVNPTTRTLTVHAPVGTSRTLREGDVLDGGDVLPGFHCDVAAVFEDVPRS